ncbi:TPA: hypothetical protein NM870_003480 [Acinetobacter baumannii]|nr:hypothetical protein [Acinetobacter baumannii]
MLKHLEQVHFSNHVTRGYFDEGLRISGIRWMPDSFNKPEEEIVKETDEKYFEALKQYCEECRTVFESLNEIAIELFLRSAKDYLHSNLIRRGLIEIIYQKAVRAAELNVLVIDVSNMNPEYIQRIKDNLSKTTMSVTTTTEFKNEILGEHHASSK